jgi:uracil-DNA glycosylase
LNKIRKQYLRKVEIKLNNDWYEFLKDEFSKPYFQNLKAFLNQEYEIDTDIIFPEYNLIFNALNQCPFHSVKVVILGQDPYPTRGNAHGLCFSVHEDVKPFPKSLQNIFREIESDIGKPIPENGTLTRWATQGVLLLNTILTVREGKPESHAGKGWELFTDTILKEISSKKKGLVFLFWGSKAQEKIHLVKSNYNLILTAPHPSPLSAYRGFFGCKHFSKTNEFLIKNNESPINW